MMKKYIYNILGIVGVALLASCSNIAEDERLIYVEPAKAARNVLIEDFTGQTCINCPNATTAIHEIQELYGEDHVVAVAIHCGVFGIAEPVGLMNTTGKVYWNHWFTSGQGQPVAKINRGAATNDYANWSLDVSKALEKETDVNINVATSYDASSRKVDIDVTTLATAGKKAKLQVWLTEDNIVAVQLQPDGSPKMDYVHNHVLRAAVNGDWGDDIVYPEDKLTKSYTYTIANTWKAENMHAVVFVYSDDEGVMQVEQVSLVAE